MNFEEDTPQATSDQLKEISALAKSLRDAQKKVERLEEELVIARQEQRKIEEIDLPDAMAAAGVEAFTTVDGAAVEIKEVLYASFPKARAKRSQAIKWLMDNGQTSIIKEDVVVAFDKGDHDRVRELCAMLESRGFDSFAVKESVNTNTVRSVIKEFLTDGKDVPMDLLGAHLVRKAEVSK